jgi:hypothetical protein
LNNIPGVYVSPSQRGDWWTEQEHEDGKTPSDAVFVTPAGPRMRVAALAPEECECGVMLRPFYRRVVPVPREPAGTIGAGRVNSGAIDYLARGAGDLQGFFAGEIPQHAIWRRGNEDGAGMGWVQLQECGKIERLTVETRGAGRVLDVLRASGAALIDTQSVEGGTKVLIRYLPPLVKQKHADAGTWHADNKGEFKAAIAGDDLSVLTLEIVIDGVGHAVDLKFLSPGTPAAILDVFKRAKFKVVLKHTT